jgi:hypothetical protein
MIKSVAEHLRLDFVEFEQKHLKSSLVTTITMHPSIKSDNDGSMPLFLLFLVETHQTFNGRSKSFSYLYSSYNSTASKVNALIYQMRHECNLLANQVNPQSSPSKVGSSIFLIPQLLQKSFRHIYHNRTVKLPDYIKVSDYLAQEPEDENEEVSAVWKRESGLKVGNYLMLRNDDPIPADVVIISSSTFTCFVETKNLDGETNLKIKRGIEAFKHVLTPSDCSRITGVIETQAPTEKMYEFHGESSTMVCRSGLTVYRNECAS